MSRLSQLWLIAAVGAAAGGCSSTDNTTPTPPNVVGSWTVTKFQFTSVASPSTKEDDAASAGPAVLAFTSTAFTITSQGVAVFTGTYTETATTLVVNGTDSGGHPETLTFALAVSGNTITLTGATTNHNFGSGDVSSYLDITATK